MNMFSSCICIQIKHVWDSEGGEGSASKGTAETVTSIYGDIQLRLRSITVGIFDGSNVFKSGYCTEARVSCLTRYSTY